jgi:hypothetical protein
MPEFTTIVQATLEQVWDHLLFKIEHPQPFVPGVSEVLIPEKTADYVIREMTITTNEVRTVIKEKITFVPYTVRFTLVDHPKLEGYVDNIIEAVSPHETKMTFRMHWVDRATQLELPNDELIKNAVLKTKTYIETHV